ncbi:D-cysteine desulfhydrase family protein [Solimonas marina]|uniref:D-cysteine desulfhydrase family protein n=1 Tax=Solimonas marina TaxID=2714601 RepID=A0A970B765_9GAMM|nr:D-cysteine desulfhydrase family protein [Solimonas marina]NKF23558.1 D-cysteine desulfhydrase family protein [Solimonas marina]
MDLNKTVEACAAFNNFPRVRLATLPTPLEEAVHLSAALKGPRIFFKRDDLTGAGLGGNKVRKLEFVLARALESGADTVVVVGGFQSNLARIASAMGARLGLQVELVLGGLPDEPRPMTGNLLLDRLFGAKVTMVDTEIRWEFGDAVQVVVERLQREGRKPFVVPLGGAGPEGMAGYVNATQEMLEQFEAIGIEPDYLAVPIGSGGTYSGLMLGALHFDAPYRVLGISVSRTRDYLLERVPAEAASAAVQLGLDAVPGADDLLIHDDYVGTGYGESTAGAMEAIRLVAETEGILLDPVYSAKCMHGVIELIRRGEIGADQTLVFLHTGGWPALFAYAPESFGVSDGPKA